MNINKYENGKMVVVSGSEEYLRYSQAHLLNQSTPYGYVKSMEANAVGDTVYVTIEFYEA